MYIYMYVYMYTDGSHVSLNGCSTSGYVIQSRIYYLRLLSYGCCPPKYIHMYVYIYKYLCIYVYVYIM